MKSAWLLVACGAFAAIVFACSEGSMAPLRGGAGGAGSGNGGGGGGAHDAAAADAGELGLLGQVYFTETPLGADAGGSSTTAVSAEFLSGVYGSDAGAPAGCSVTQAVAGETTCTRYDCAGEVGTDPVGARVSAGRLTFTGLVDLDAIEPDGTSYATAQSGDVAFWQSGASLGVEAAGATFPAFSAQLSAPPPMSLTEPAAETDGRRLLSRSAGFTFRTGVSVTTLRLAMVFVVTSAQGQSTRATFACAAPGANGVLQVSSELLADLAEDSAPDSARLFGEEAVSSEVADADGPVGRVLVAARRLVSDEAGAPLAWSRFVVQP